MKNFKTLTATAVFVIGLTGMGAASAEQMNWNDIGYANQNGGWTNQYGNSDFNGTGSARNSSRGTGNGKGEFEFSMAFKGRAKMDADSTMDTDGHAFGQTFTGVSSDGKSANLVRGAH